MLQTSPAAAGLLGDAGVWLGVIVVSFIVVHVLKFIFHRLNIKLNTLEIIEIVVVVGLLYMTMHGYIEGSLKGSVATDSYKLIIIMLFALVFFSIISGGLWILHRLLSGDR